LNALVIGNGPHSAFLINYVRLLNISDQVYFYGACYDEILLCKFFVNSLALVFPGPIGLSAIHSLTYGVPVITNDNEARHKPEFEAIIDGGNGFLFKDGCYISLSTVLKKLLNLTDSEKEMLKITAVDVIKENYTPQKQALLIFQHISNIR